ADFPAGAMLKITGPDGKTYSAAQDDDKVYALAAADSLETLVIKDPPAGDYKIALTVPQNVAFHFELATLPSKDVGQTIHDALANISPVSGASGVALQTSGAPKGKGKSIVRPFDVAGLAAAGVRALQDGRARLTKRRRVVEVLVPEATGGAMGVEDFAEG